MVDAIHSALSPRDRRRLSDLRLELQAGRVALLLGAGADKDLAGVELWGTTIRQIFNAVPGTPPDDALIALWPVELAMVARQRLGDESYYATLRANLSGKERPHELWGALAALAKKIPLVVTTNVTDHVWRALGGHAPPAADEAPSDPPRNVTPVVVERSMLRSVRLPQPGVPHTARDGTWKPLLVYLHGRLRGLDEGADGAGLVFDSEGYAEIEHADPHYPAFLQQLFERWTVLAYGFSFSDPPIRVAAVRARHLRPELRATHVWIDGPWARGTASQEAGGPPAAPDASVHNAAAVLAYAVQRVEARSYSNAVSLLRKLGTDAPMNRDDFDALVESSAWSRVADALDEAGDYESLAHVAFFGEDVRTLRVVDRLLARPDARCPEEVQPVMPITIARLERHLRHHLHFVTDPSRDRIALRLRLWGAVLDALETNPSAQEELIADEQLAQELLVGYHEVAKGGEPHRTFVTVLTARIGEQTVVRKRIDGAPRVWGARAKADHDLVMAIDEDRRWAAGLGWESIEAKLALDQARAFARSTLAKRGGGLPTPGSVDQVLRLCEQAKRASQVAGTMRRYVGAVILSALWTPHRTEALRALQAALSIANERPIEHTLRLALRWAWLARFGASAPREAFAVLGDDASAVDLDAIRKQEDFWRDYTPVWAP